MKWICTICKYVHEGDEPPDICPVCKKRGYHAGNLVCPRCSHTIAETLCTQKTAIR